MHGDERSPSDMDCYVTLPRGTQTQMLPTWGLAVCLHTRNGSQQHGAATTGGRSVPCKHCGLTRRRSPVGECPLYPRQRASRSARLNDTCQSRSAALTQAASISPPLRAGDACRPIADRTLLAAPNKCLALSNKSRTGGETTKKRQSPFRWLIPPPQIPHSH